MSLVISLINTYTIVQGKLCSLSDHGDLFRTLLATLQDHLTCYYNSTCSKGDCELMRDFNVELRQTDLAVVSKYAILVLAILHLLKELFQAAQVRRSSHTNP